MKLEDVKIGEKYSALCDADCINFEEIGGEYIVITEIVNRILSYDIYDKNGVVIGDCYGCFNEENIIPYKPKEKTMENLEVGDIVVNNYGEKMILGICGKIYFISEYDDFEAYGSTYTASELQNNGYTLKQPNQTREMTQEEIEKALGYKIKIKK